MMLFLSDLHLPTQPSPLREGFLRFLAGPAQEATAVYILGDLFEVWIGDDVGLRDFAPEAAALRQLTHRGVAVFYQHGNRDFMVSRQFFAATGIQLLKDPVVVQIDGRPTLLSHGDLYCTDDIGYQRWRKISRLGWLQSIARNLPLALRYRIAGGIRSQSAEKKQMKPVEIMDVNLHAIEQAFREHAVPCLIHGHTHRPAVHELQVDGHRCERIVLADWRPERMEILRADASGFTRLLV